MHDIIFTSVCEGVLPEALSKSSKVKSHLIISGAIKQTEWYLNSILSGIHTNYALSY